MPAADFCRMVRVNRSTLSHDSVTCSRSPEVSSIAFHAQPLDLPPVPLMDVGFAIIGPLARHRRPLIQFLFIGSRVCSALLSDRPSRFGPCASLSLHLHQAVKRTCTSKLSNLLGTPTKTPGFHRASFRISSSIFYFRLSIDNPATVPQGTPAAFSTATGAAACAAPSPQSAGCARGLPQRTAQLPRACARCRRPAQTAS